MMAPCSGQRHDEFRSGLRLTRSKNECERLGT